MDKKEARVVASKIYKEFDEFLKLLDSSDPKSRFELNGVVREMSGKVGDYKKKLTSASRFKVPGKRGRPALSDKPSPKKPVHAAKKLPMAKKPVHAAKKAPAKKLPMAKKPAPSIPATRPEAVPAMHD